MTGYNGLFQNLMPDLYSPGRNNVDRRNHSTDWTSSERRESDHRYTSLNNSDFNNSNSGRYLHNSSNNHNYGGNSSTSNSSGSSNDDSNSGSGSGRRSWLQCDYESERKSGNQNSLPYTRYRPPSDENKKRDRLSTHFRI
ncbi:hypothetical protein ACKWTF_014774 [Chironomus riparius]